MTGGAACFVVGGTESFVIVDTVCFVDTFLIVLFAYYNPNLPCAILHSCK